MYTQIKKSLFIVIPLLLVVPTIVFAQGLFDTMDAMLEVLALLPPVFVGIALVVFIWGVIKFVFSAGSVAAKDNGKQTMIWGVIALFVIVAVWGLVAFLGSIFGINSGGSCPPPQIGHDSVFTC